MATDVTRLIVAWRAGDEEATVDRDSTMAKAWLAAEPREGAED
jgi:hypothetical protein